MPTVRNSNLVPYDVLNAIPIGTVGWEIRIFDVDSPNTLLAVLNEWITCKFSVVINDVGSGEVTLDLDNPIFSTSAADYIKAEQNIWKVFVDDQLVFAFSAEDHNERRVDQTQIKGLVVGGRGVGMHLEWGTVIPPDYPDFTAMVHTWADTPPMSAFLDLLEEAQARGSCGMITPSFDHDQDGANVDWVQLANLQLKPGSNLLALLPRFAEAQGAEWIVRPDMTLDVKQSFGNHYEDTIKFYVATHQLNNEMKRTRRALRNVVFTESADGSVPQALDTASITSWLRRETYVPTNNATDEQTAQQFANAILDLSKSEQRSRTFKIVPGQPGRREFFDFNPGDWISLEMDDEDDSGAHRVLAISVEIDSNKQPDVELTTTSLLEFNLVNLQKQFERLTGQNQWLDSALQVGSGDPTGAIGGGTLDTVALADVQLGSTEIAASPDYTWFTVVGAARKMMVWRFVVESDASLNWGFQVRSEPDGAGELMFEATGIGELAYNCSWPWMYENQESPPQTDLHIGVKVISGAPTNFRIADLRGEVMG